MEKKFRDLQSKAAQEQNGEHTQGRLETNTVWVMKTFGRNVLEPEAFLTVSASLIWLTLLGQFT